jgi:mannose-6-phosphate isomerase-like protein (cupin superfamily)
MNTRATSILIRRRGLLLVGIAATAALVSETGPPGAMQDAQRPSERVFYAPKPTQPTPYLPPMKPLVRLADLKQKHKGHADWSELLVDDKNNRVEVISAPPGSKVQRHLHSDSPEYWIVEDGRIRFEIEDPPGRFQIFEAVQGDLVLAPERHLHSLEVTGSAAAIRVQVTLPDTFSVFETKPEEQRPDVTWTPVTLSTGNNPDEVPDNGKGGRLFFRIDELAKEHPGARQWSDLAVRKNRAHANIICGYAAAQHREPGNLGHYHADFAETWVILRGSQSFAIEGEKPFIAEQGDVVYAPANRWHLPEPSGEGLSCRLAMTPFPAGNHLYQPREGNTAR